MRWQKFLVVGVLTGALLTGCSGTALEALASLPVKGRAPKTGYDRDEFGSAWTDATTAQGSSNGGDTRNDVLRRHLDDLVVQEGSAGCVASTGKLDDFYSGQEMTFVRGEDSSSGIHIDHVICAPATESRP